MIIRGGTPHFEYVSAATTDGCTSTELLPGTIVPGAYVASVYVQVGVDLAADPSTTCATAVVLEP